MRAKKQHMGLRGTQWRASYTGIENDLSVRFFGSLLRAQQQSLLLVEDSPRLRRYHTFDLDQPRGIQT